jgi:hypothetical protein
MLFAESRSRQAKWRAGTEFRPWRDASSTSVMGRILDRCLYPAVCVYIVAAVSVPSGRIYGFNFKAPLYLVLVPSALYAFSKRIRLLRSDIGLLIGVPVVFMLWIVVSQIYGFSVQGAIRQYSDILLTLFTCWLISVFCEQRRNGPVSFIRLVIFAETSACVMKVVLLIYAAARGIPVSEVVQSLNSVFGANLMDMDLGALLGRVQFVSDGLIPICVYAILRYRTRLELSGLASIAIMTLLVISVVFSFSRYFWGFTCIATLLGIAFGPKDKIFVLLVLTLGIVVAVNFPLLSDLVNSRFSQNLVSYSDEIRVAQVAALDDLFFEAPLIGHGLGSYSTQLIRGGDESKYSYEVQLLALAAQIGIVGLVLLTGLGILYFRHLLPTSLRHSAPKLSLILLLIIWLAAGLFNPLLLNPAGAVSYGAIMAMGKIELIDRGLVRKSERAVLHNFQPLLRSHRAIPP